MKRLLMLFAVCALPFSVVADPPGPTAEEEDFAREVTDTLQARVFALLLDEFASTTPENFEAGNAAISLVFNDAHRNFRLVGNLDPLGETGEPQDRFERKALEEGNGWRRSRANNAPWQTLLRETLHPIT